MYFFILFKGKAGCHTQTARKISTRIKDSQFKRAKEQTSKISTRSMIK